MVTNMKIRKTILAVFMAAFMLLTPQAYCFAAQQDSGVSAGSSSSWSPNLISNGFSVDKSAVYNGDTFKLTFNLKNTSSKLDIRNVNMRLSGGDIFSVDNDVDTLYIDRIAAAGSRDFSKSFYCSSSAEGGMYPITVSASYEYYENGEKFEGSSEFSFSLRVNKKSESAGSAQPSALTPKILISDFTYGGAEIQGGETFNLNFRIKNNAKGTAVQNIIIKLSGGETFVVADGTDTVAVNSLGGNSAVSVSKSFKCLNSALSGVYPVTASVSYEYYDAGEKMEGSTELTMSIPVIQPDKIEFQGIQLADKSVTVDQENDCAFQLINSGQTRLANGIIKLIDENGTELASAFIGNIDAGTQFTSNYTLPITFTELGDKKLKLVFEYENENMEKKSIEQEFGIKVEEYFDPFSDINTDNETAVQETNYVPVIIGCVVGVVVIIAAAIIIKKVIKKRKEKKGSEAFDEEI